MENQQAIDLARGLFLKVLSENKMALVDTLNKDGFPTSPNASEDTIVYTAFSAMQISSKFRDDLANLMHKHTTTKKSFAPYQNDLTENLIAQDIMGNEPLPDVFYPAPLFTN
jgi:hypothetical protein